MAQPMKKEDFEALVVSTTKPRGRVARALGEMGVRIVLMPEDEGNVDRYVLSKRLVNVHKSKLLAPYLEGGLDRGACLRQSSRST